MSTHSVPRIARYVSGQAWAIQPHKLDVICEILAMRAQGITLSTEEIQARIGAAARPTTNRTGAVAVIPLYGVLAQKINSLTAISGGTSLDVFLASVRQAVDDPGVSAIVIDGDSPGGVVEGCPETFAAISQMRGIKPIVAVANPSLASAAYWIACAADEIVCTPSGAVGSIGVFAIHEDLSQQNEMVGYRPTYISAGTYKTELSPDGPLSADARAYLQGQIDQVYGRFTRAVAQGRGVSVDTVRADFGQGRMLLASDALAVKMIDRIDTLDATIARLARGAKATAGRQTSASVVVAIDAAQSHETPTLLEALETASGARRESLDLDIATDATHEAAPVADGSEIPPSPKAEEDDDLARLAEYEQADALLQLHGR
jgi:capsid assembly protease